MMKQVAVFTLLVVLTSGCSGKTEEPAKTALTKEQAIAAIKKLGGSVTVDEETPGKPVVKVYLRGTKVTDTDLVYLKGLTNLRQLSLYDTNVTDAGLVHLKGLTKLRTLSLSDTKVTDAGLVHLKGLTKIENLDLSGTQVTDSGLMRLKGLTKLQSLGLADTKVIGLGINRLKAALPKCAIWTLRPYICYSTTNLRLHMRGLKKEFRLVLESVRSQC